MPLTDTRLRNLKLTGKRHEIADRDGLVLRVSQLGILTWTVVYRVQGQGQVVGTRVNKLAGPKRRDKLGEYPAMGLAEARMKAAEVKQEARAGLDPARRLEKHATLPTVQDLVDRYVKDHLQRQMKAGSNVEKLLFLHVIPRWGKRPLNLITRRDFVQLLEAVRLPTSANIATKRGSYEATRGGPGAAAEVRKWTRAMFQFATEVELIDKNPLADVTNRDRQSPRDRILSMQEIRCVLLAAATLSYPWRQFIQLIALTGDRRGEWANAKIQWLQGENLSIPAKEHKSDRAHLFPLSQQAQQILKSMPPGDAGPYLISTQGGANPISGFSYAKRLLDGAICKTCEVCPAPWTFHDLRRTMSTNMERLGVAPHVIEACLGHSVKGIGAVYRLYDYLPEKKRAFQLWADEIMSSDLEPINPRQPN